MGQNEETGRVANFRRAAGHEEGASEGRAFNDTDVYKLATAVAAIPRGRCISREISSST
jgi:DUF1680 family protein